MFRWVTDVERGDWIAPRLGPFDGAVGSVVPHGYEAYARVLHRVPVGADAWLRWGDVAARTGATLHPTAQWWKVARRPHVWAQQPLVAREDPWPDGIDPAGGRRGEPDEWMAGDPMEGQLDPCQLTALTDLLRGTTDTNALTAAFWVGSSWAGGQTLAIMVSGRGPLWRFSPARRLLTAHHVRRARRTLPTGPDVDPAVLDGPLLELPAREHFLFTGSFDDVAALATGTATADVTPFRPRGRTPSLLWPDDRTWCLATEVDFDSTLLGGPRALVDSILAEPTLEAFEVGADDSLAHDGDALNR